ncbi:MAG: anthranilate phosphoribosyltransferase [Candidatus Gracilibacteria bacterium]|nr:anthranilate phosphoribosyltransferase [Candidatus Gracilibacteria bacterium]MDQ7022846.1 anthranilate phosphoribosyltransferase [Candidatus Gracilibacteria bacterium]
MLNFIKRIINNPENFSEDEKYEMLLEVADKKLEAEELAKIIRFIKSKQTIKIDLPNAIDIAGTGGSGLPRINTSTLCCLKLAKLGIKIAKHGNNASSGRFGSFDLIETLKYTIPESKEEILEEVDKNNVAFLHAKKLYPFFKHFAGVRKRYAKPTIFNIIGPLLNPANTDFQIIGCSFEDKMELMIETCKILGRKNVLVVRGEDGLDEITLSGKTKVFELSPRPAFPDEIGVISEYLITPEDFGFQTCKSSEIFAEEIDEKIEIAKKIINFENVGKFTKLVDLNVKVALKLMGK